MANADDTERAEQDILRLVSVCHKTLNYWQILRLFLVVCEDLMNQAEAEYWQKQH